MELPSYPAHIRDRVANAFLPENGVMRVTNPWVAQGVSPVIAKPTSETPSGAHSPVAMDMEAHLISAGSRDQLPSIPPPPGSQQQPLDWVNSELLLSLDPQATAHSQARQHQSPPESAVQSPRESRFSSRRQSRHTSRAPSPEHSSAVVGHSDGAHSPQGINGETFVHSGGAASRHLQGLFHVSMKPFSSLTNGFTLGSRSPSHTSLQDRFPHGHSHLSTTTNAPGNPVNEARTRSSSGSNSPLSSGMVSPASSNLHITPISATARPLSQDPISGQMLLHRAFTETPDYEVATRGFLGGGLPPLDSFRDLPSYEDAAAEGRAELLRSRSETDVAVAGQDLGYHSGSNAGTSATSLYSS